MTVLLSVATQKIKMSVSMADMGKNSCAVLGASVLWFPFFSRSLEQSIRGTNRVSFAAKNMYKGYPILLPLLTTLPAVLTVKDVMMKERHLSNGANVAATFGIGLLCSPFRTLADVLIIQLHKKRNTKVVSTKAVKTKAVLLNSPLVAVHTGVLLCGLGPLFRITQEYVKQPNLPSQLAGAMVTAALSTMLLTPVRAVMVYRNTTSSHESVIQCWKKLMLHHGKKVWWIGTPSKIIQTTIEILAFNGIKALWKE